MLIFSEQHVPTVQKGFILLKFITLITLNVVVFQRYVFHLDIYPLALEKASERAFFAAALAKYRRFESRTDAP